MNIFLVILGACLLAAIGVVVVSITRRWSLPACPACKGRDVKEVTTGYICQFCGEHFIDD